MVHLVHVYVHIYIYMYSMDNKVDMVLYRYIPGCCNPLGVADCAYVHPMFEFKHTPIEIQSKY